MIWKEGFNKRLVYWNQFRDSLADLEFEQALFDTNQWWAKAPWIQYNLHWDDLDKWPDPWQLLEDNRWCNLAKCLGISYTIIMSEHVKNAENFSIIEYEGQDLVQFDDGKYVLNYSQERIVNIHIDSSKIKKTFNADQLIDKIK